MSHLTEEQSNQLYLQLLEEKLGLEKHFATNDHYGLSNSFRDGTGELSMYDNHPADVASEIFEREKDISLNEHAEFHLRQVDEALAHMEKGDYGHCIFCDSPIPFERLQAIPTTLYCKEHVPDPEQSIRRPVEEQVLYPPFGRTSFDERNEETEFDGEDAWQIVESWGTSNTPAFAEDPNVENYNEMYIEADENVGYVESFESFVATDLYGEHVTIVRSKAYRDYMHSDEGDPFLEPENRSLDDEPL
ncbi:TraR/DksA C4-type zinc finger protein [Paenibacillus anseongense]|uniref:TraR/DksA C4-type zinc finger protein n=1 Tax=Paenibacillus anseongense TaxID=2682845 RepID=UPI002DBA96E6|nr:TraR/DksA C4-type zinc finger protein [Paenibacillus anseongense]MEC0265604.1 TraR/DksA C4-type zinc finger protein [Paenibacillus anseongense]